MKNKANILIVDDDPSIRQSLSKVLLHSRRFEVMTAADGRQAEVQFDASHTDLLLLDLSFDRDYRDGWGTFHRLIVRKPLLPVIVITALSEQFQIAAEAGVAALLEKPVEARVLLDTIDDLMREPRETQVKRACNLMTACRYAPPGGAVVWRSFTRPPTASVFATDLTTRNLPAPGRLLPGGNP